MPTSSQALIMKNTEFSSLPHLLDRNQLSGTEKASYYGLPRFKVAESAVDSTRFSDWKMIPIRRAESVPNIRLRLDISTLPELLQVRGIHGAVSYDMTTRSFHWRLPKTSLSPFRDHSRFSSYNSEQGSGGHNILSTVAEDGSVDQAHLSLVEDKNATPYLPHSTLAENEMSSRFKYQHMNTTDARINTNQREKYVELGRIRRVSSPEDVFFLQRNLSSGNRGEYGKFLPELNRREFKSVRLRSQTIYAPHESHRDNGGSLILKEFEPEEENYCPQFCSNQDILERRQNLPQDPEAKPNDFETQLYDRLVRLGFRKLKREHASPKVGGKDTNNIKQINQGDESSFHGHESASSETRQNEIDANSGRALFLNESRRLIASVRYKNDNRESSETTNISSDHDQASEVDTQDRSLADNNTLQDEKSGKKISLLDDAKLKANYRLWKKRKIMSFRMRKELPPSDPLSVVVILRDNAITHEKLKQRIEEVVGCKVTGLRFDPVSVHIRDNDARSQWIVSLPEKSACEDLIENGMWISGERIHVRSFDHVMKQEHEAYKFNELLHEILSRKNESRKQGFIPRKKKQSKMSPKGKHQFTQTNETNTA